MTKRKRVNFDLETAISDAWDILWKNNLRLREQDDEWRKSTTYYLTASDVENQVRLFAAEALAGKPRGSMGIAYGRPYVNVRLPTRLFGAVRDWLFLQVRQQKLAMHNFGRGSCTGARFRPYGSSMGPAEEATMRSKARQKEIIHYHAEGKTYRDHDRLLCMIGRKPPKRNPLARQQQSHTRFTDIQADVTCPRCLKRLAARTPADITAAEIEKLKLAARRAYKDDDLKAIILRLEEIWKDDHAAQAFYTELEAIKERKAAL